MFLKSGLAKLEGKMAEESRPCDVQQPGAPAETGHC